MTLKSNFMNMILPLILLTTGAAYSCLLSAAALAEETEAETVLDGHQLLASVGGKVVDIATKELQQLLKNSPETVVIDVRTPEEIASLGGMIEAQRNYNITRGWLEFRVGGVVPSANTPIVVYCGRNERSPLAANTLMEMGYTNVRNYAEGFFAWEKAGLPIEQTDKAVGSMLYSKPQKVADGVWSAIGATAAPSYANSGHNNNLSFIVTDQGVVVVNAGDNYLLAQSLHKEIQAVTDQPVKFVVLENGQGHAAMGSAYWKEQGVPVIAHKDAAHELEAHGERILERVRRGRRDKAQGTRLVMPDETFENERIIELGDQRIELLHLGPAHSPGDIVVWLPQKKLVISGDMAFHERLLPVFEHTDTGAWIETWDEFATLGAEIVIPGHGGPTDMEEVTRYTRDYLAYMRERIGKLIEEGGNLEDVQTIDQSAYRHLDTFDELAALNASTIFRAMEFE